MKNGNEQKVTESRDTQRAESSRMGRLQIIAALIGFAVLLAGGARWGEGESRPSPMPGETQVAPEPFEYFPAQYENQATEREEHIQAF